MKALDKLRGELHDFAADIAATPHKVEELVDSRLLQMRNRRYTTGRIALALFFAFVAGAAFQALVW